MQTCQTGFGTPRRMTRPTLLALWLTLWTGGCALVGGDPEPAPEPSAAERPAPFSHADYDAFLHRHVDATGRLDYRIALSDRSDLDRYRATLAATSPDVEPLRFATEAERLAYWLNAYNASAIGLAIPIGSR